MRGRQGCPFLAEARDVRGPPAGQASSLGLTPAYGLGLFQKQNPADSSLL